MFKAKGRRRLSKFGHWVAIVYILWGLFAFFGTLGSESHSWWPIFLTPIVFPLNFVFGNLSAAVFEAVHPGYAPAWAYTVYDYVSALLFIGGGAVWLWWLGRLVSILITWIVPFKCERPTSDVDDAGKTGAAVK